MNVEKLSLSELVNCIKDKKLSAKELTEFYLNKISEKDDEIKAFISIFDDALSHAEEIDKKVASGKDRGSLLGIPIAIKDNILIKGKKTTAGSKILENYNAVYDAYVIEKLKNAGAVFLGKTNMDEFAMGSSTETSAFFKTKNPNDTERVPGGSSGGSAACVAAGEAPCALGSDTGGSIRQPSAFCGVVGLKPTYGSVSRYGLIAMASSLDQIGPITRSVEDAKLLFETIRGKDRNDATSVEYRSLAKKKDFSDLVFGLPDEYFSEGVSKEVIDALNNAVKELESKGAKIKKVKLPHTEYALASYYVIMPSEVSSNMARYDGIKYGFSDSRADLLSVYLKSRSEGLGDEVKRRIMLGTYALSSGYYDAYYKKAQKVRTKIIEDFKNAFLDVDIIIGPTTPTQAFKIGEKTDDPLTMYMADVFTVPVNLAGLPAISIPAKGDLKLPVGIQMIAPWFCEDYLFLAGSEYQKN